MKKYFHIFIFASDSSKTMLLKSFIESLNLAQERRRPGTPVKSFPVSIYPNQTTTDSWDLTPHHRLYVRNVAGDDCPGDNCRTSVNLTLRRPGGNESRIWDHVSTSSFVTRPAILNTSGQAYTTGFALKFWNWTSEPDRVNDKVRPINFIYIYIHTHTHTS
jgi:hypothetical protein